ncbi:hypothetical protein LguiB_030348 [Lonicera macranthoides]
MNTPIEDLHLLIPEKTSLERMGASETSSRSPITDSLGGDEGPRVEEVEVVIIGSKEAPDQKPFSRESGSSGIDKGERHELASQLLQPSYEPECQKREAEDDNINKYKAITAVAKRAGQCACDWQQKFWLRADMQRRKNSKYVDLYGIRVNMSAVRDDSLFMWTYTYEIAEVWIMKTMLTVHYLSCVMKLSRVAENGKSPELMRLAKTAFEPEESSGKKIGSEKSVGHKGLNKLSGILPVIGLRGVVVPRGRGEERGLRHSAMGMLQLKDDSTGKAGILEVISAGAVRTTVESTKEGFWPKSSPSLGENLLHVKIVEKLEIRAAGDGTTMWAEGGWRNGGLVVECSEVKVAREACMISSDKLVVSDLRENKRTPRMQKDSQHMSRTVLDRILQVQNNVSAEIYQFTRPDVAEENQNSHYAQGVKVWVGRTAKVGQDGPDP